MEVMKHFYRLSGFIQALLISWMIHPSMAEGRVLEYKPLDFGLQVAGIQDSEIECLTRNIYFEAATEDGFGKLAVAMATLNRVRDPCPAFPGKRHHSWRYPLSRKLRQTRMGTETDPNHTVW